MYNAKFAAAMTTYLNAAKHRDSLLDPLVKATMKARRAGVDMRFDPSDENTAVMQTLTVEKYAREAEWKKEVVTVAAISYYVSAYMAVTLVADQELPDSTLEWACNEVKDDLEIIMARFIASPKAILDMELPASPAIIDLGNIFMPNLVKLIDEQNQVA